MAAPKKRREAERELKKKGFTMQPGRGKGSHEVWKNAKGESVTVPKHGDEIAAGTWRSIERQTAEAARRAAEEAAKAEAARAQQAAGRGVAKPGSQSTSGSNDKRQDAASGKKKKRGFTFGR
jgi:predicted RNA binding protein YcfA (HicA-like mRNA interferase family)